MGAAGKPTTKAIGDDLAAVLPNDGVAWWKKKHLLLLNYGLFSLFMFSSANGYDGSLMNGLLVLPPWNEFMDHPKGAWLGFINAIYWIGNAAVFPISAWVVNRWGRRVGIWIGYVALFAGVGLQTGAPNEGAFIAARALVGVAAAWFTSCVPLLINETAYPTHRGVANALYNCGWYVGSTIGSWVTFGVRNNTTSWSWRLPSLLQILCPLIALPGFLLVPESPRWLVSMDRVEDARAVLTRIHGGGDPDSALVAWEIVEIETTIRAEKEAHASTSYLDMVKTKGNRHRLFISMTLAVFSQWTGNGVISYYLSLVLNTVGVTSVTDQLLISAGMQIWNLIFAVGAAVLVDRLGRRFLFLASAGSMLISYVITTGLSGSFAETGNSATGLAVVPFLFLYFAGYDIALTPLVAAYPCEIWPYRLRSRGLTVTWLTVMAAIIFNTWVNPIALEAIEWRYYIVFVAVIIAFGIVAFFWYPETRGHSLEQMAILFDGDDAEVGETMKEDKVIAAKNEHMQKEFVEA